MEGNTGAQYAYFGLHYVVGVNNVEDSYVDFELSHHLDSADLVVVGNIHGTADGGSLVIDMGDKMCGH